MAAVFKKIPPVLTPGILLLLASCTFFQEPAPPADTSGFGRLKLEDMFRDIESGEILELDAPSGLRVSQYEFGDAIRVLWDPVDNADYYVVERAGKNGDDVTPFMEISQTWTGTSHTDQFAMDRLSQSDMQDFWDTTYVYRVQAVRLESGGLMRSPESETAEGALLLPPSKIITATKGQNPILLEWETVPGASRYHIYRSETYGQTGVQPAGVTAHSDYTDYTAEIGTEYYYTIKSVNQSGLESQVTTNTDYDRNCHPVATAIQLAPNDLTVPAGLTASKAGSTAENPEINLTWEAVEPGLNGAVSYKIYRSSSLNTRMIPLNGGSGIAETAYTDTENLEDNVDYYYYVHAVENADGLEYIGPYTADPSGPGHPAAGYLLSPPDPDDLVVWPEGGSMRAKWEPARGAETYSLYGSAAANGTYALISEVTDVSATSAVFDAGGSRFFRISSSNSEAGATNHERASVKEALPETASALTATRNDGSVPGEANGNGVYPLKVTWTAAVGGVEYNLYRSGEPDGYFQEVASNLAGLSATDNNNVRSNIIYYYKVKAVNSQGQEGEFSDVSLYGYGAVTAEEFMNIFHKTLAKSQTRLTNMHKSSTDALGDETKFGNNGGTVNYDTPDGILQAIPPFDVINTYSGYADYPDPRPDHEDEWSPVLDGASYVNVKNMDGDAQMRGIINMTGMYEGSVDFGGVIVKSEERDSANSRYAVTQTTGKNDSNLIPIDESGNERWE